MGNRTGASANPPSHHHGADNDEDIVLLAAGPDLGDDDDYEGEDYRIDEGGKGDSDGDDGIVVHPPTASLAPPGQRTPRTPNRVRFDLRPTVVDGAPAPAPAGANGGAYHHARDSLDDDGNDEDDPLDPGGREYDYVGGDDADDGGDGRRQQRQPLLTDIEAPTVALANSGPWGRDEAVHDWADAERRRPKSSMGPAFMNMANSIIGAGIIGQPYAFRQAGLLSGIVLLVGLTFVVDWTICLIVLNSKLSGANSFQGTVEHCFGRTGLIAISVAQWAFAFGGMVAFGIIVGDSIPHVLLAVWPGLRDVPVVGLLADRRVAIVVFVLGISYPLTLYRDISKVAPPPPSFRTSYPSEPMMR